jgi:hypothetical protein
MKDKISKSAEQTSKFFEDFIRKDKIAEFIKEYRKFLDLPKNGLPLTDEDIREFNDCMIPALFIPEKAKPFWIKKGEKEGIRIINTCKAFVRQEIGVESIYIEIMLRNFLIFNKNIDIPKKVFNNYSGDDFFKIEHIPSELSWYSDEDHYLLKCMYEHFEYVSKKYPVALYINPEATQNQVKDFISKNWDTIKFYQAESEKKIKFNKTRKKRNQKINDLIYENRKMPLAKIREKLSSEDLFLDDGHISKIIQIEKKRRS